MFIERIKVSNFKSFDEIDVQLRPLNVFVGANASGKSNFASVLTFLRDIAVHGLANAVSMHGGPTYIRNIHIGAAREVRIEVSGRLVERPSWSVLGIKKHLNFSPSSFEYKLTLKTNRSNESFSRSRESLRLAHRRVTKSEGEEDIESIYYLAVEASAKGADTKWLRSDGSFVDVNDHVPARMDIPFMPLKKDQSLLELPHVRYASFDENFGSISSFDIDPKLPMKAFPVTGKAHLEEDCSNLAVVLKQITRNPADRRKLINLLSTLLPFVDDLDVEHVTDRSLVFRLRERGSSSRYLPAYFLSDGTINIVALIVCLYFDDDSLLIIEEPEKNIHPYLISNLTELFQESSDKRQIVITTHSPEIVRSCNIDDLFLVTRDAKGFSRVTQPKNNTHLGSFLKNDIGVADMFVQDLLGV